MEKIEVVAAIIMNSKGQYYCCQRPEEKNLAGYWEFPGGKIEPGEGPKEAVIREIREELACTVKVEKGIGKTCHEYNFGFIELDFYICRIIEGYPKNLEHNDAKWVNKEDLINLEWAPADIAAVECLIAD